ncbi:MAG: spore germination protein [Ruminococcaceae bacterium]|nr:spore germination protein [Oscillospiraceae bacterium]
MMAENNYDLLVKELEEKLRVDESFDINARELTLYNKKAKMYFIDGCVQSDILERVVEFLMNDTGDGEMDNPAKFISSHIPHIEAKQTEDIDTLVDSVLKGETVFLIEGISSGIMLNVRSFPSRDVDEPENERVIRGSRDGFVENILKNTAIIRKRIRDPALTITRLTVGTNTKTDVAVIYVDGKADKEYVDNIVKKIKNINVYGLCMGHESLAECLIKTKWYNPFPKIRYTERPDAASAMLLEGSVIILCDNSPEAMILPTSIFDFMQETGDYYHPPLVGSYMRLLRIFIFVLTIILTPLWYLLITNPEWLPSWLEFIKVKYTGGLPVITQLLLLELAIDGLKLASLNTPNALNNSLSVIGGLILGEYAVQSGWFIPEVILYMAFVSLANFAQPSNELGYAFKFMRVLLLILTALFNLWGFVAGIILSFILVASNKTANGKRSYLYPLFPFNAKALKRLIFRVKL